MKLAWLYMIAFLGFPFFTIFFSYISNNNIITYSVELELVISYFIHLVIMILIAGIIAKNKVVIVKNGIDNLTVNSILNKSIFIALLGCLIVFILAGYKIIFGGMHRGELRLTIGAFGPIYNFTLVYLTITLVSISSIAYMLSSKIKKFKLKLIVIFVIVFFTGFFIGSKSTIVMLTIPGISILIIGKSIKNFLMVFIVVFFTILFMTMFERKMEFESAFSFMLHRATNMSAYGTVGVWNELSNEITFDMLIMSFLSIFGASITTLLTGYEKDTIEFLYSNIGRLITYIIYPDTKGAIEGSVNLTVTNFGEAVFYFGKHYFWIYSIFSGIIIGITIRYIKKNISLLNIKLATLLNVYFFSVIIPWLNSGGTFNLISLPNFFYFSIIYIILKYILMQPKQSYLDPVTLNRT